MERKYLEYFDGAFDSTVADKMKPENKPYVAYSKTLGVAYTIIPTEGEVDPTEGFVDLGLSVMWASCNLGASNPEETGYYYRFGDPLGYYKDSGVFTDSYHGTSGDWHQDDDPVFINAQISNKDILFPHVPTADEIKELVANTIQTFETINGIEGIRFTATNGNSIFMPICDLILDNTSVLEGWFAYWSSTYVSTVLTTGDALAGALYAKPDETARYNSADNHRAKYGMPIRGVCHYAPKHSILEYNKSVQLIQGDNYFALMRDDISDSIFIANTIKSISIAGLDDQTDETLNTIHNERVFNVKDSQSELYFTQAEMNWHRADKFRLLPIRQFETKYRYQYIKITCEEDCTLTMNSWDTSLHTEGFYETALIRPGERFYVKKGDSTTTYRLLYAEWQGGDLEIVWDGSVARLPSYISDTCHYFLSSTSINVVQYDYIKPKSSQLHDAVTVNSWANRVDADGYLYVRFDSGRNGYVTFKSIKPISAEPNLHHN